MLSLCSIFIAILVFRTFEFVYADDKAVSLQFTSHPTDNDAIEGTKTLLSCYVEGLSQGMVVSWMRDDTRLSKGTELLNNPNKKRYKLEVNNSGHMYIIFIDPVQMSDADHLFFCAVYKNDVELLKSKKCRLNIKQVPSLQFPQCSMSKPSYIENDRATVTCMTEDVDPEPTITLMYENRPVTKAIKEKSDGHVTKKYTFTVDRKYDGKTIICSQRTTAVQSSELRNCSAGPFRIKYKPNVTIQGNLYHHIGKEELYVCRADAKPAANMYLWSFEPNLPSEYHKIENNDQVLRLNIPDNYNGTTIRCEVYNSVGSSMQEIQIFTYYDPSDPTFTVEKVGSSNDFTNNKNPGSSVDSTTMLSIAGSALMLTALLIGILLCYFQICKIQRNSLTASGYRIAQPEVYFVPKDSIAPSVQNCDCNDWKRTVGIQVPTDLDIESVYMDIEDGKKTCSHKSV
ncbi:nephrin-like [Anneissia japonica]|uniref:nephrin-like n=1 Tax=Anneissia japonica TaxID=1529436 RepID=UPI0014258966|nr:nephrin-like [Anneissia japonica]XP_033111457.1 nephrin-like [Anneissia japonica]